MYRDGAALDQSGRQLALRCYEMNELAQKARGIFTVDLERVRSDLAIYAFAERLKGQENIQNKVLRRRDELRSRGDDTPFEPEDITDAWGCRFVTLFQSQILDVMGRVLSIVGDWRDRGVMIKAIEIYTNRPEHDPISIAERAVDLIKLFNTRYAVTTPYKIEPRVDSRDSGYSSIHFVLCATLERSIGPERFKDFVNFEVQIRDIFEEAWSQVSHVVSYREKDRQYQQGAPRNRTADFIARPQLNALKTVADGCSQLADQIRKTYDDLRGRLSAVDPTKTYMSVVPLSDVRKRIVDNIPAARTTLIDLVNRAYGLLSDAHDAADRSYDNRVSRFNYRAAADQFRKAIERADQALHIIVDAEDGKTVEWYLEIEYANALVYSLPGRMSDADEDHRKRYGQACAIYQRLEAKFAKDPVVQLRRSQADRKAARSPDEIRAIINRLEHARNLAGSLGQGPTGDAALTKHQICIELGIARLEHSERIQDQERKKTLLREAIKDVQEVIDTAGRPDRASVPALRVYHRALSNTLWFHHRLRTNGAASTEHDLEMIAAIVDKLRSDDMWSTAKYYPETIENLMYGYKALGKDKEALKMAELNLTLLTDVADDRRQGSDQRDAMELLEPDEKNMYVAALLFRQEHVTVRLPPLGQRP